MKKSTKQKPFVLPGDLSKQDLIERMIRVNHAGEYGAKRIYQGQLDVLKNTEAAELIEHMAEQEEVHLSAFEDLMTERRVRPSVLFPLWHAAGYALGAVTALMGEKAAMACTVAVESVIAEHYQNQLDQLDHFDDEKELQGMIQKFREEEMEHHDIGIEHHAEEATAYPLLSSAIKTGSRIAIWLAERV